MIKREITKECVAAFLVAGLFFGQTKTPILGPADGKGLPPTDLTRVSIGMKAPDFTLSTWDGRIVTLSEFLGKKNVVLNFFIGGG